MRGLLIFMVMMIAIPCAVMADGVTQISGSGVNELTVPIATVKSPGFLCSLPLVSDTRMCTVQSVPSTNIENIQQTIENATFNTTENSTIAVNGTDTTFTSVYGSNISVIGNSTYFIPETGAIMIMNSTAKPEIGNWTDVTSAFKITVGVTDYSTLPVGYHAWERVT